MIISHKHKFIFIKTRKTAGTSIEISLSRYCGENDIIAPISVEDEKIRNELGIFPQNYFSPLTQYNLRDYLRLLIRHKKKIRYRNHASAWYVKQQVGERIWNSYYKFCFERNPWDKTVSLYYWINNNQNQKITFDEFLKTKLFLEFPHYNYPLYTHDNSIIVDFVGRYENLQKDLKKICEKVGIDFDGWLPKAKASSNREQIHYSKYFNDEQIELIRTKFQEEITAFEYNFDQ